MGNSKSKECLPRVETGLKTGVLNLSGCGLSNKSSLWSNELFAQNCSKLKVLDISCNALSSVPTIVLSCTMLKTLNAMNCSLDSGMNLSNFNLLLNVDLTGNNISLNKMFVFPIGLKKLKLGSNNLVEFPSCLLTLINLTELDLSNNLLSNIIGIGSLISLVELKLENNRLTELPIEIGNLNKLRLANIERNMLIPFVPNEKSNDVVE